MAASDATDIPPGLPVERVDALYGLPLDEFTTSRDALAGELRRAGQRDEAAWVKALRKPSAAAWLVNQLARSQAREVKQLLEAGRKLREAHERALTGNASAGELRRVTEQENEAVRALLAKASGLLDREGRSPSQATLERAEQTLRAVALDERTRAEFAAGRLTREGRATGLGLLDAGVPDTPAPRARKGSKTRARGREGQRRSEQRASLRETLKEAKAEQRARRRVVSEHERTVQKARSEVERAQRRLEEATSALEQARAAETEAEGRVAEAAAALERAS
jgi:hypothetical protein